MSIRELLASVVWSRYGECVGGIFWTRDEASGLVRMEVTHPSRNRSDMSVGDMINGNMHVTKEHMVIFDAANPHCAQPFVGTRYSVTYYTLARCREIPEEHLKH